MKLIRAYLDVEVKKLAKGRKTKFPAPMVLELAASALRKQRRADQSAPRGKRDDSLSFLQRLFSLEDPRG